jgi:N-acetylmuramoyl-L-alanine amidase
MKKHTIAAVFIVSLLISFLIFPSSSFAATYKVTTHDSLYTVSKLFKTSVSTLKKSNNIYSTEIHPGQKLKVSAVTYTVKKGDTLFVIAKKYGITVSALKKANAEWDNSITPGKKLIIPGVKPHTTAKKATTMSLKSATADKAVISYSKDDLQLLAKLITAEASGQPYDAMVGVGAVVVNRVQSKKWPNTIKSVIYQVSGDYYQFSPVKNGYINNPPTAIAIKAAKAALYGNDPSKGAMFYFDDSSTNKWLWSKPLKAKIGNMVFVE